MKRLSDVISYSLDAGWSETEAELLAHLFAWAATKYSTNEETKIPFNVLATGKIVSMKSKFCDFCNDLIAEVKKKYQDDSEGMLDQVIKCVIHGLPYNVILECSSVACANEVRRLMEDSFDYVLSMKVAKHFISSRDIYEFRRVFKILHDVDQFSRMELYKIAMNKGWMAMSAICEAIHYFGEANEAIHEYHQWEKNNLSCYEMIEAAIELRRRI